MSLSFFPTRQLTSIFLLFLVTGTLSLTACGTEETEDPIENQVAGDTDSDGGDSDGDNSDGDNGDGDSGDGNNGDGDANGDGNNGDGDADGNGDSPASLSGIWAKEVITSALSDTFLGEEETTTTSILLVNIEQDGGSLTLTSEVCAIEIDSRRGFAQTEIPPAFINSLPAVTRSGTYEQGSLTLPWAFEVRGVEFLPGEDPETTPLPTEASDPRVFDQDEDGNPGLTVFVDAGIVSGDIYVIQRGRDTLSGQARSASLLEGTVQWDDEQVILGASNQALMIGQPTTRPNPEEGANRFAMVSLSAGASCTEALEAFQN